MSGHPDDFLTLVKEPPPAHPTHESEVRVYADTDGALRTIQSDGTDAAIGGGVSSQPFAFVYHSSGIDDWDGSPIPFDSVYVDNDGLWDPIDSVFVAAAEGWYAVAAFDSFDFGFISVPASAATSQNQIIAFVHGPGNNVCAYASQHTEVTSGAYMFSPVFGYTFLRAGDSIDLRGNGGTGWKVFSGAAFSIQRVA